MTGIKTGACALGFWFCVWCERFHLGLHFKEVELDRPGERSPE